MNKIFKSILLTLFLGFCIILITNWIKTLKPKNNIFLQKKISRRKPSYLQNKDKELKVKTRLFYPRFIPLQINNSLSTEFSNGSIKFNLLNNSSKQIGSVISKKKYKNIANIYFTIDLTKINNLNYINTSFYLVNDDESKQFMILETIGNKIFQTTSNSNNYKSSKYNNWNFSSTNLVNIVDPGNAPFDIKVDFIYGNDPKIKIYTIQNDEMGLISEESFTLPEITSLMAKGFKLVSAFSQKYVPSNRNNNMSIGSWEINDIKIKGQIA